jgi:arylsulfatase A-like enzyme
MTQPLTLGATGRIVGRTSEGAGSPTLAGMTHVRYAAENADLQLGRLLNEIKQVDAQRGGKTLVVLTADHGATSARASTGRDRQTPATATGTTHLRRWGSSTPGRLPARRTR